MISNEQHPCELHVTWNKQEGNKQIEKDLIIRTAYQGDRHDDLDNQNYIRHHTVGNIPILIKDNVDLAPKEHQKIYNPWAILKDKLNSIQEMSKDTIILTSIMHYLK